MLSPAFSTLASLLSVIQEGYLCGDVITINATYVADISYVSDTWVNGYPVLNDSNLFVSVRSEGCVYSYNKFGIPGRHPEFWGDLPGTGATTPVMLDLPFEPITDPKPRYGKMFSFQEGGYKYKYYIENQKIYLEHPLTKDLPRELTGYNCTELFPFGVEQFDQDEFTVCRAEDSTFILNDSKELLEAVYTYSPAPLPDAFHWYAKPTTVEFKPLLPGAGNTSWFKEDGLPEPTHRCDAELHTTAIINPSYQCLCLYIKESGIFEGAYYDTYICKMKMRATIYDANDIYHPPLIADSIGSFEFDSDGNIPNPNRPCNMSYNFWHFTPSIVQDKICTNGADVEFIDKGTCHQLMYTTTNNRIGTLKLPTFYSPLSQKFFNENPYSSFYTAGHFETIKLSETYLSSKHIFPTALTSKGFSYHQGGYVNAHNTKMGTETFTLGVQSTKPALVFNENGLVYNGFKIGYYPTMSQNIVPKSGEFPLLSGTFQISQFLIDYPVSRASYTSPNICPKSWYDTALVGEYVCRGLDFVSWRVKSNPKSASEEAMLVTFFVFMTLYLASWFFWVLENLKLKRNIDKTVLALSSITRIPIAVFIIMTPIVWLLTAPLSFVTKQVTLLWWPNMIKNVWASKNYFPYWKKVFVMYRQYRAQSKQHQV